MRIVVFLKNNPNVIEDALERNPHYLLTDGNRDVREKKKEQKRFLFFKLLLYLHYCSKYLGFLFIFTE